MRLITRADDELYGLASVAGKLGRAGKLLDRLDASHLGRPDDPELAFASALAQMAMLPSIQVEFAAHSRFTETIDAFGRVLAIEPRHWLARYSRARLRALIPSSYGAFTVQVSGELTSAADDLADLLTHQADSQWQPYFASTHALAAVVAHLSGATGRSAVHVAGLLESAPTSVRLPALGAVLSEPLVTLYATSVEPDRQRLGELMAALYGDQSVVAQALGRQPQRTGSMP